MLNNYYWNRATVGHPPLSRISTNATVEFEYSTVVSSQNRLVGLDCSKKNYYCIGGRLIFDNILIWMEIDFWNMRFKSFDPFIWKKINTTVLLNRKNE